MKIYPSKHRIKKVEDANIDRDISVPLAYLDEENVKYDIKSTPSADFSVTETVKLLPNTKLINQDVLIFNEYGVPVNSETIINNINNEYYYYPNNMVEFDALKFLYDITIKKNLSYSTTNKYNINLLFMDDPYKLDFANRLSKILMSPYEKGYLSDNITFNNNDKKLESFTRIKDNIQPDFVFIESDDGEHYNYRVEDMYDDEETLEAKQKISYESFLNNNTNIWIISDDNTKYPISRGTGNPVELKKVSLVKKESYNIKNYYNINDFMFRNAKVHKIFDTDIAPIIVMEHENRGFVIYSSSEIFEEDNIYTYKNLIYEVLFYVYCHSYKKSAQQSDCITYTVPDYEVRGTGLERKFSFASKKTINEIIGLKETEYHVCQINIYDNNDTLAIPDTDLVSTIDHIGCRLTDDNDKKRIIFELDKSYKATSVYQEPDKNPGWVSILYNTKVYYIEEIHYLMETNIQNPKLNKLFLVEEDLDLVIRLYPFKSSKHGINVTKDLRLVIPYIKTTVNGRETIKNESYAIYYHKTSNSLQYLFESDYQEAEDRVLITTLTIVKTYSDQYLTDMRLKGGGLPEDMPDNYNLLDIGHIYGRPYRQANTLVITLPKKYEPYKNEILEVINKYKVAEDYPVIFFEDDEMDGEI